MKPTLLDTGAIVAFLDASDRHHRASVEAVEAIRGPLVTCEPVIAEACYLLRRLPGAPEAVIHNVTAGIIQIPFRLSESAPEILRTLRKYKDLEIDLADACLIHLANDLQTGDILTLDRDFQTYRWGKNRAFRMLITRGR